ncbi:MAG: hypothetical protein A2885_14050 [Sphingopyxis sp. RIFCSPHIGHO2_01_FULL_65_24]|nr:MAG: hypothetical protein A2885_14050 [Sphingopyxis sp. RIFCSPHIGHO2_01_FULL_65_24]
MILFEENEAILRDMEARGSDLGPARTIDFSHVFPDQMSAEAFAEKARKADFAAMVEETDREEDSWDVTASIEMTPTCENITSTEERLDAIAREHGGRADGWGFWRV